MDRRTFIQSCLRGGILAGLAGGVLLLAKQNKIDFTCSADGVCKSCSAYSKCELEKAKESRKDER